MENRILGYYSDRMPILQRLYETDRTIMKDAEHKGDYALALASNNAAYRDVFDLYQEGVDKPLQMRRMRGLIRKASRYLKQLNLSKSLT
jgi:hypothetical protein